MARVSCGLRILGGAVGAVGGVGAGVGWGGVRKEGTKVPSTVKYLAASYCGTAFAGHMPSS